MTRTTFKNAHGLTEEGHLSTARDMTILGRHLFYDYPEYYNLFSRRTTDAGVREVANTNRRFLDAYAAPTGSRPAIPARPGSTWSPRPSVGRSGSSPRCLAAARPRSATPRWPNCWIWGSRARRPRSPCASRQNRSYADPKPRPPAATERRSALVRAVTNSPRPVAPARGRAGGTARGNAGGDGRNHRDSSHRGAGSSRFPSPRRATRPGRAAPAARDHGGYRQPCRGHTAGPANHGPKASVGRTAPRRRARTPTRSWLTRLSTSGGRLWGINVGRYSSRYKAERVLLKTALAELGTLDEALRKVAQQQQRL